MKILVTNDDGIDAPGLAALVAALRKVAQVTIAAPDRERSATGHGITMNDPITVRPYDGLDHPEGWWAIGGTPADCTKIALGALMSEPPDLVVSGVNRGSNLGTDVLYSGTVSAAAEAVLCGIPGLAISCHCYENPNYEDAAQVAATLAIRFLTDWGKAPLLLNVNVPNCPTTDFAGLAVVRLGTREYKEVFDRRQDPRGRTYYWMSGELVPGETDPRTDVVAIENNYITVTPLQLDMTAHHLLERFSSWEGSRVP